MSITILDCYRRVLRMTKVVSGRLDVSVVRGSEPVRTPLDSADEGYWGAVF